MSKKRFIEKIEVKTPCSEDWGKMTGNEKVRFCSHCAKSVNNLSAMTRKEALKIVKEAGGNICVRYVKNPASGAPVFAEKFYQITRRAGIAAGVLGASLSLSTLSYAQGEAEKIKLDSTVLRIHQLGYFEPVNKERDEEIKTSDATISGVITDPNGAAIPHVTVNLTNDETKENRIASSNDEGFYKFENLPAGAYELEVKEAYGFSGKKIINIRANEGAETAVNVSLTVAEQYVMVGAVASVEYSSPLLQAVSIDDVEEFKKFIANGEDVNFKDKDNGGVTALFLAVANGNYEIAETLLNLGAKVNARDENKRTPLMYLDDDAPAELVLLLIKHGAKVNLTDEEKNTALILAAEWDKPEILQILIDHGADVNARNAEGQTALMNAAYEDDLENVKLLILAGADVNLKNKEGETAWSLTDEDEIKKLLESHGAVVEDNQSF